MMRAMLLLGAAGGLAGCMSAGETGNGRTGATAVLAGADGSPRGSATLRDASGGLAVKISAEGLPAGTHGIHIHTTGRCEAPDFASAGGHWNPTARQHGRDNPQGAHHGDLPNLVVGADGRATLAMTTPGGSLAELFDADGAALVIHASADDNRTDPSGNSGGRIACGVITR